jgi:hypothetical protein
MTPTPLALLLAVAALVGVGCNRTTLPYKPDPQPPGARISAASEIVGDRLRIEIDTGGRLLEQVWIRKPDGTSVAPQAVDAPPVVTNPGPSISIGVGGGTFGRGGAVGTSTGVGFPIGGGSSRVQGNTIAWFPLAAAGPAPWPVYVKLAGVAPVTFAVGGPVP